MKFVFININKWPGKKKSSQTLYDTCAHPQAKLHFHMIKKNPPQQQQIPQHCTCSQQNKNCTSSWTIEKADMIGSPKQYVLIKTLFGCK